MTELHNLNFIHFRYSNPKELLIIKLIHKVENYSVFFRPSLSCLQTEITARAQKALMSCVKISPVTDYVCGYAVRLNLPRASALEGQEGGRPVTTSLLHVASKLQYSAASTFQDSKRALSYDQVTLTSHFIYYFCYCRRC